MPDPISASIHIEAEPERIFAYFPAEQVHVDVPVPGAGAATSTLK